MIDKDYIKRLAQSLCFELSDEQTNAIIKEIQELDEELKQSNYEKHQASPVYYTRVVNCAKFRKDVPDKQLKKDYLSNAKVVDKYVVGK